MATTHGPWDLKIVNVTETRPGRKPRKSERFEGELSSEEDGFFGYVFGRTRAEVIENAFKRKSRFLVWSDAEANAERIKL